MNHVQTNVRVEPSDKPLILAVAQRLRSDPGFRERLAALLGERDHDPVLRERVERLEEQVEQLLASGLPKRPALRPGHLPLGVAPSPESGAGR